MHHAIPCVADYLKLDKSFVYVLLNIMIWWSHSPDPANEVNGLICVDA